MSTGLTLEEARIRYKEYLAAEQAVLLGQEYELATGEKLKRENLDRIRKGMQYWEDKCNELDAKISSVLGVYPIGLK